MTAKTNGAEFKRFYADISIWPEDAYHDGVLVLVDGVECDRPKLDDMKAAVRAAGGKVL